jgi:hypothetical protein
MCLETSSRRYRALPFVVVALAACGASDRPAGQPPTNDSGSPALDSGSTSHDAGTPPTDSAGVDSAPLPDAAPPLPCEAAGSSVVGVWEDITPPEFKASSILQTTSVAVDPLNPGVVYATAGDKTNGGTGSVGVFKSSDCGATWNKVSAPGSALETGDVWQILVDPIDSKNVWATNGYGNNPTVYKSENGGVDFTPMATDVDHVLMYNFVRTFSIDPTNGQHVVLSYHELCTAPLDPLCMAETRDGGTTWRQFNGPPLSAADLGGDGGGPLVVDDQQVFFMHPTGVWYSSDGGATWNQHLQAYKAPLNNGGPWGWYLSAGGAVYLGVGNMGIFRAQTTAPIAATAWEFLMGSPMATGMVDDGVNLYASIGPRSEPPYFAPLADLTKWTAMPTATSMTGGANTMSFDNGHGIGYGAAWSAGLWRFRTK